MEGRTMNALVSVRRLEPSHLPNDIVTEDSAATEFVERHGQDLRYCHTAGAWFIFETTHWREDGTGKALQMARVLARQLSENQDATKFAGLNRTSFTSGIERFSRNDPQVAVTHEY
jgi:putative DNA primase/helicase